MVKESEVNAEADRERKALIEAKNLADNLVYQSEKTLRDLSDKVDPTLKAEVEAQVAEVKKALEADDKSRIVDTSEALQQTLTKLGQAAYQQAEPQTAPGGSTPGAANGSHGKSAEDENVVEGEFSEA